MQKSEFRFTFFNVQKKGVGARRRQNSAGGAPFFATVVVLLAISLKVQDHARLKHVIPQNNHILKSDWRFRESAANVRFLPLPVRAGR